MQFFRFFSKLLYEDPLLKLSVRTYIFQIAFPRDQTTSAKIWRNSVTSLKNIPWQICAFGGQRSSGELTLKTRFFDVKKSINNLFVQKCRKYFAPHFWASNLSRTWRTNFFVRLTLPWNWSEATSFVYSFHVSTQQVLYSERVLALVLWGKGDIYIIYIVLHETSTGISNF